MSNNKAVPVLQHLIDYTANLFQIRHVSKSDTAMLCTAFVIMSGSKTADYLLTYEQIVHKTMECIKGELLLPSW